MVQVVQGSTGPNYGWNGNVSMPDRQCRSTGARCTDFLPSAGNSPV
jgi:hypothetical protein